MGKHAINSRTRRAHNKRNKIKYLNKANAEAACFDGMRPYLCHVCCYWHIGHELDEDKWKAVGYERGDLVCLRERPDYQAVVTQRLSAHRVEIAYLTSPPPFTPFRLGEHYDEVRKERIRALTDEEAAPWRNRTVPPPFWRKRDERTVVAGSVPEQLEPTGGGHDR